MRTTNNNKKYDAIIGGIQYPQANSNGDQNDLGASIAGGMSAYTPCGTCSTNSTCNYTCPTCQAH